MVGMSRERRMIQSANSSRQAAHFWTAERIAKVRECAAEGFSVTETAEIIGNGCTRGMVAGQSSSLKIKFDGHERFVKKNRVKWLRWRIEKLQRELAELEASETETPSPLLGVSRETSDAEAA